MRDYQKELSKLGLGSARLPYQFLETSRLEVVSLQSLSLVVLAPLGGCGQHVKD